MKRALALAILGPVLLGTPALAVPEDGPMPERPPDVSQHMFCDTLSQMQRLLRRVNGNDIIAASKAALTVNKEEKTTACGIPKFKLAYVVERHEDTVANGSQLYAIYRVKVIGMLHNEQLLPRPMILPPMQFMAIYLGRAV